MLGCVGTAGPERGLSGSQEVRSGGASDTFQRALGVFSANGVAPTSSVASGWSFELRLNCLIFLL